jgi:hypothetical protein
VNFLLIPYDKALHALYGTVIYAGCHAVQLSDNVCLGVVVAVGVAKELLWDYALKKGTLDVWDAVATGLGGVVGYSITFKF